MLMFRQSTYAGKILHKLQNERFYSFFYFKNLYFNQIISTAVMLNARAFGARSQKRAPSVKARSSV
jgi:hypothetical protein